MLEAEVRSRLRDAMAKAKREGQPVKVAPAKLAKLLAMADAYEEARVRDTSRARLELLAFQFASARKFRAISALAGPQSQATEDRCADQIVKWVDTYQPYGVSDAG